MSKHEKSSAGRKKPSGRLWGVDALALGLLGITALMVQAALREVGATQAWAVFVAAGAGAVGLGMLLRYAPARQVVMLTLALVLIIEVVVFSGTLQPGVALADVGSTLFRGETSPPAAALGRLGAAGLFLIYLVRPRVAKAFSR